MAVLDMVSALQLDPALTLPHAFFGVYDGHNGDACAAMLVRKLHVNVAKMPSFLTDLAGALVQAFQYTDAAFLKRQTEQERISQGDKAATDFKFAGATAAVLIARREPVETASDGVSSSKPAAPGPTTTETCLRLYIAHVGDCRVVLSHEGRAFDLTLDHKPSTRPDEVERIQRAGGWVHNGRLHGVLAVSRAFGDAEHKILKERFWETSFSSDPLVAEPDIRVHTIHTHDEFVVIACDGIYDVMSSQMVVNFVRQKLRLHRDVQKAAEQLVAKALTLNSVDNCSAFVIVLNGN